MTETTKATLANIETILAAARLLQGAVKNDSFNADETLRVCVEARKMLQNEAERLNLL